MRKLLSIFLLIALHFFCGELKAQVKQDTISVDGKKVADSSKKNTVNKFDPRKATVRSAMVPGWGQIYNKKYWKLPLVWGALGITTAVFIYNVKTYKLLKTAYIYKIDTDPTNDSLVDPRFINLSPEATRSYRNSFRQNVDYSVVFFILFWGLQVVDATVDGHLKAFDVNDNLSLRLKPGYSPMANTNGISLVLDIHSKKIKAGK